MPARFQSTQLASINLRCQIILLSVKFYLHFFLQ